MTSTRINTRLACRKSLIGFAGGVAVAYGLLATIFLCELMGYAHHERLDWHFLPWPAVVGLAFAAAAFAAYLPPRACRYIPTLGIVLVLSYVAWMLMANLDVFPKRVKGVAHPRMYPAEAVIFFVPPLLIGCFLGVLRIEVQRFRRDNESSCA